jgi:hypothetical protein
VAPAHPVGGAKSLALVFERFQLPAGGELYVYDDARRDVRGAYTELENRLDGSSRCARCAARR